MRPAGRLWSVSCLLVLLMVPVLGAVGGNMVGPNPTGWCYSDYYDQPLPSPEVASYDSYEIYHGWVVGIRERATHHTSPRFGSYIVLHYDVTVAVDQVWKGKVPERVTFRGHGDPHPALPEPTQRRQGAIWIGEARLEWDLNEHEWRQPEWEWPLIVYMQGPSEYPCVHLVSGDDAEHRAFLGKGYDPLPVQFNRVPIFIGIVIFGLMVVGVVLLRLRTRRRSRSAS